MQTATVFKRQMSMRKLWNIHSNLVMHISYSQFNTLKNSEFHSIFKPSTVSKMKGHWVFGATIQTKQFVRTVMLVFRQCSFLSRGTSHHLYYHPTQSEMSNNAVNLEFSFSLSGEYLTGCYLHELGTSSYVLDLSLSK